MRMLVAILALTGLSLHAEQPSAKVDVALRARVDELYNMMVNRQYRQAESLVADESKDYYYQSRKSVIKSFRIEKIEYSPGFKTAVVTIQGEHDVLFAGAGLVTMSFVDHSHWKIEKGKWCWYFDKDTLLNTPFGRLDRPVSTGPAADAPGPLGPFQRPSAAALQGGAVQVDPNRIQLDARNPQPVQINLKNTLPGAVHISVASPSDGLKVAISKPDLASGESMQVTVTPEEGTANRPEALLLRVLPTNQTISVGIVWAPEK